MAQSAGRLTCPRCGANNFNTVTVCWKCNTPLAGEAPTPPSYGMPPPVAPALSPMGAAPVLMEPSGDPAVAKRAALSLALLIPWVGLPVGWVFMMCEDRRRQAIGRYCVNWSLIALIFHVLISFVMMQGLISFVGQGLPRMLDAQKMLREREGMDRATPSFPQP